MDNKKTISNDKKYLFLIMLGLIFFALAGLALFLNRETMIMGMTISIALIILGLLCLVIGLRKGIKLEPDYRSFFYIGLVWLIIGLPLKNYALFILGLVFLALGLINKDKWKEKKRWAELPKTERWIILISLIIGILALLTGLYVYYLAGGGKISI
ncbi:MAG: hypothetical protein V1865_02850 [bacterium]